MNENKTKISVVVPVYNVEKYLERCVESLLAQTYKNFEIILVDDGSPDNCPKMCDEYALKFSNVKSFHTKNRGQGAARNFGVSKAEGEFVSFVDSDDYVDPNYLEVLFRGISKSEIAVVDSMDLIYDKHSPVMISKEYSDNIYSGEEALSQILYQSFRDVAPWGMLVPRYIVEKYPFPENRLFEDYFTTYKYFLYVKKVCFIYLPLYFYTIRPDSTMFIRDDRFINDLMAAADEVIQGCSGHLLLEKAAKSKRFSNYCRLILQPSDLETKYPNQYKHIIDTLKKERLSILLDRNVRKKNRIAAFSLYFGIWGLKFLFKVTSLAKRV